MKHRELFKAGGDAIEEFSRSLGADLGGLRISASRGLQSVHDIDISQKLREAILYGITPRPVITGDQAMQIGPETPRNIQETEPNIFRSNELTIPSANTVVVYRPSRPEMLHRLIISHFAIGTFQSITIGTREDIVTPSPGLGALPNIIYHGSPAQGNSVSVPIGRTGLLLTPSNPLFAIAVVAGTDWVFNMQLSEAILSPV